MKNVRFWAVVVCMMAAANFALAEIIRGINIDFVNIGNAGNATDTGGTPGCGDVDYNYRIGKYEITNTQWNTFTAAASAPTGNDSGYSVTAYFTDAYQPINEVSWYETLQFCNYLTSGDKSKGAYLFNGNNTNPGSFLGIDRETAKATWGTIYVLPTEDEWYKAAYYKPNDSGYSLYANGQNTIPDAGNGWNYYDGINGNFSPWNVGIGTQEQNGTFDMMGNVWEWNETLFVGSCVLRGGSCGDWGYTLASSDHYYSFVPNFEYNCFGFRVAEIPEPCSLVLLSLCGLVLRIRRTL